MTLAFFTKPLFWLTLLLAVLPLGTRTLLAQFTPGFHEYEAVFLYASDIALLAFLACFFATRTGAIRALTNDRLVLLLAVMLGAASLSLVNAEEPLLGIAHVIRLASVALFAYVTSRLLAGSRLFERILLVLVLLAVLQSVLGLMQFKMQENLGLGLLGESPISRSDPGTSKVAVGNARLVRAYGTFPHPNVLAAFLVMGLLALFHFYLHTMERRALEGRAESFLGLNLYRRIAISAGIFIVAIGLTLTFSRAAWLTAFLASLPFVLAGFRSEARAGAERGGQPRRLSSLKFLAFLLVINYLLFAILGWAAFPRAQVSGSEPAVRDRVALNRIGLAVVRGNPFGVGIGNQVLTAVKRNLYVPHGFRESWTWEPIHNLYLLIAAEIGVVGLAAFLVFLCLLFIRAWQGGDPRERMTALTLLFTLLVLGLFDHFFWTIEQGRLMLWLAIGMLWGISNHGAPDAERKRP